MANATVTIGQVTADGIDSKIKDEGSDLSIFTDYQVRNRYVRDRKTFMMGITSPAGFGPNGDTVAFARLSNSTLLWVCEWTACRFNETPDIPNPESRDPSWVLLSDEYEPVMMIVGPDGVTPLYRIRGTYVYGRRKTSTVTVNDITFPLAPWLENVFDRSMSENKLNSNISESQSSQSPGGNVAFAP